MVAADRSGEPFGLNKSFNKYLCIFKLICYIHLTHSNRCAVLVHSSSFVSTDYLFGIELRVETEQFDSVLRLRCLVRDGWL